MNRSLTIAAASLTLVGCGAGVRSSASEAASTAVESTVPVPNAPASGAAVADCLVGQWDVDAMTSVADPSVGFDLSGITAAFDGANLTITAVAAVALPIGDGDILSDDPVGGSMRAAYVTDQATLTFRSPVDISSGPFDAEYVDLIRVMVPETAEAVCDKDAASLTSDDNVVVLTRLGPAVATTAAATTSVVESTAATTVDTTAATTTADSGPPSVEGLLVLDFGTVGAGTIGVQSDGSVQIDLTNADLTLDCLGRVVHVDGAATGISNEIVQGDV